MAEPITTEDYTPPPTMGNSAKRALPAEIVLNTEELEVAFTPRELRMIRETCGSSWTQIVGDDADDANRFAVMAWLKLRREGYDDATLDDMEDVVIRLTDVMPDPTNAPPSITSPPFATTGE